MRIVKTAGLVIRPLKDLPLHIYASANCVTMETTVNTSWVIITETCKICFTKLLELENNMS